MRRGWLGPVPVVLAVILIGCTRVVPGAAVAGAPTVPPTTIPSQPSPSQPSPSQPSPSQPPGSPPSGPRSALDADVVADECLLDAAEFDALLGVTVRPPQPTPVQRAGGGPAGVACVAGAGTEPVGMINVYTVRSGVPADYVRGGTAGGRRDLTGVGEAAAVVDTLTGPTLQLASPRFLVTISVTGGEPSDEAWRTAAAAALSRLPA